MKRRNKRKTAVSATAVLTIAIFIIAFANKLFGDKLRSAFAQDAAVDFDKTQDFVKIMDVGQADAALIYSNGCTAEAMPTVNEAEKRVVAEKGRVFTATEGMNFDIGEFEVTVLAYFPDAKNENDRSVITMAKIGDKKFLFTGDAEKATEADVLAEKLNIDCDVLKVGHHGSKSSSSEEFLKAASPEYAAISVGKDNSYSHPNSKTLASLRNCGAKIYRTDRDGDISFFVENSDIRVSTEK